ncbi:MAG: hypothetical protein U0Q16_37720 [Bryobacteraceae bacterium]
MGPDAMKDGTARLFEDEWDREMARDFAPGGRGEHLIEKVDREIAEGKFTSFEEGLRQWRTAGGTVKDV